MRRIMFDKRGAHPCLYNSSAALRRTGTRNPRYYGRMRARSFSCKQRLGDFLARCGQSLPDADFHRRERQWPSGSINISLILMSLSLLFVVAVAVVFMCCYVMLLLLLLLPLLLLLLFFSVIAAVVVVFSLCLVYVLPRRSDTGYIESG